MEIYLLRHGLAAERGAHRGPDSERPLTAEGRRKMRRVAKAMRAMRLSFDVIFSSPLVRARQTAEIVAEVMRLEKRLQLTEQLVPEVRVMTQITWLKRLRPAPGHVLLVGHEPNFSELTSHLLTGSDRLAVRFKKAGLCLVTAEHPGPGCATLEWLLTPRQMELMR